MKHASTILISLIALTLTGCYPEQESAPPSPVKEITTGMTKQALVNAIGEPDGYMNNAGKEVLFYSQQKIILTNGIVDHIPPNWDPLKKPKKSHSAIKLDFKNWKAKLPKFSLPTLGYKVKNSKGEIVDHNVYLVKDRITLIEFHSTQCGRCNTMEPDVRQILRSNTDVSRTRVNIRDWDGPLPRDFRVEHLPDFRVFDASGKLMGSPTMDLKKVKEMIKRARS